MMHIVLYKFTVKNAQEDEFITAWEALTKLIHSHEGSLGSRLHKEADGVFIAYAQWPSLELFDRAGERLPAEADGYRAAMREACSSIETIHQMEVVKDLLV